MKTSMFVVLLVVLCASLSAGCFRIRRGRGMEVHTASLQLRAAPVMVARRVRTPLYIVLDPRAVLDAYVVPEDVVREIRIFEVHAFVQRHLAETMRNFFEDVRVVAPDAIGPGHVMYVTVQRFGAGTDAAYAGGHVAVRFYGSMTWALGIRAQGEEEYVFAHTDTATGDYPGVRSNRTPEVFQATYRVALERLVAHLLEQDVPRALMALDPAVPAVPPAPGPTASTAL